MTDIQENTDDTPATDATTDAAATDAAATDVNAAAADTDSKTADADAATDKDTSEAPADQDAAATDDSAPQPDERVVPAVDDYTLPEGMPKHIAEFAHKNDMTQAQLDNTLKTFAGITAAAGESEKVMLRQQGEAHVKSWGEEGGYKMALAKQALALNDPDGNLKALLDSTEYGSHPAVLDFFVSLGNDLKEGGFIKGSAYTNPAKHTAAQKMFGNSHPSKSN